MFCNNCGTQYDVIPVEIGKSKFCKDCGVVLYKNENNNLVFNTVVQNNLELQKQQEFEAERLRQEQLLKQRQLEIDQQKQIEAEKLRQELLIKQREIEIEREKKLEAERLHLAKLEQERQFELQKQYALEQEKQKQIELQKQQELAIIKKRENELLVEKERELQHQREVLELEKNTELENLRIKLINEKEAEILQLQENETIQPKSSFIKFFLTAIIAAAFGAGGYFLIDKFVLNKTDNTSNVDTITNSIEVQELSPEKIKTDLIGNDITGWGAIDSKHITSILSNINKRNDTTICIAALTLEDKGVKSNAEVTVNYKNNTMLNVVTNKITFKNTATPNSWFTFAPVAGCAIFVNTNNNPIQLKGCENCPIIKMNTNSETAQKLANHPESIFITSDSKYEAVVDFTYIPEK